MLKRVMEPRMKACNVLYNHTNGSERRDRMKTWGPRRSPQKNLSWCLSYTRFSSSFRWSGLNVSWNNKLTSILFWLLPKSIILFDKSVDIVFLFLPKNAILSASVFYWLVLNKELRLFFIWAYELLAISKALSAGKSNTIVLWAFETILEFF